jgi:beta-lactam-binding protein with PASTA domain
MKEPIASLACLIWLALVTAGCGGGEPHRVPDVTGERLDVAQDRLDAIGLRYETVGGGALGVVVRSHWTVCSQEPKAGTVARAVHLVVDRSCPLPPPPRSAIVPEVTGERLDDAERELERLGVRFEAYADGDGPIVVAANWTVCDQYPAGGEAGEIVELYAEHVCHS